nr:HK97-gp10 family putative phage morphogenesis protein [Pseudogemmobacter hezensis]
MTGFKELEQALAQIEKQSTQKAVARRALKKGGEPLAAKMRQKAPRDDGQLQDNIAVSTRIKNEVGNAAYARVMRDSGGIDKETALSAMRDARRAAKGTVPPVFMYVGPTVKAPHAHLVEFGTAPHINGGKFAGTKHPGTAPQPFARPAWDEDKEAVLKRIGEELGKEITKAARRAANKAAKAARG